MKRLTRFFGSLRIAVTLLLAIAAVLAWATIYETRFGTAAVQRVVYRAWWFQSLLAFLAANLAMAAWLRRPWRRRHLPFLLAHLGIICILVGGIIGGRFGIDGQLLIPEGESEKTMRLPSNVLVVHQPNPGTHHVLPTEFDTRAWAHEPHALYRVPLDGRDLTLVVDRYYPDALIEEQVVAGGGEEAPAVRLTVRHAEQSETLWLLARDPERFGVRWGDAHLLFLEPQTQAQADQLLGRDAPAAPSRGVVTIRLPAPSRAVEVPVPERMGEPVKLSGTPYTVIFKDYFADFALTDQGPRSRSEQPNNPAVAFLLSGPEGTDTHLLFAFHPEIASMHGWSKTIPAEVSYSHPAGGGSLPPNALGILRLPSGELEGVMTGPAGERKRLGAVRAGERYPHPWLGYEIEVVEIATHTQIVTSFSNRSSDVRREAIHVTAQEGGDTAQAWLALHGSAQLPLGKEPITVEYRPEQRDLPMSIKLLDFRKIEYPGSQMAAGFESDVQLSDPERGLMLMRKISMNNPLRYRGYSFYQSSFIPGAVETTVLSVRNDPGTPLVYAGFLVVIGGVVSLFTMRNRQAAPRPRRRRAGATT
ncbi:MAG: cytochrome c biogenesis protein ResB [Candidatus Omnitrophica bacterium]|nr:cytochrome c biogenesis protein ResB [Candidatus Omnitrophota bacterium]